LCLDRELELIKSRQLLEIREVPFDDESNSLGGSPVSVRLALPVLSVAKCLSQADAQIRLARTRRAENLSNSFFTPEAHILLAKTCEQLVIELSVRAFLQGAFSGSPNLVSAQCLRDGIASAWASKDAKYAASQSFDFLRDVTDRFCDEEVLDDLDNVGRIHQKR
jgi:hypothetical protein